jgi:hypothetical protein
MAKKKSFKYLNDKQLAKLTKGELQKYIERKETYEENQKERGKLLKDATAPKGKKK